eukprot:scaffold16004_cov161-Isochrysis_galbana.AAC.2
MGMWRACYSKIRENLPFSISNCSCPRPPHRRRARARGAALRYAQGAARTEDIALAQETTKAVEMSRLYQLMEAKKDEAFLNGLERGFAQGKSMLAK